MQRIIIHVDLDCFFAAVEARDNPEYRNVPLIVGADPKGGLGRGVVTTCSYEARKFGLHSGMPISKAFSLCPQGIYVTGSHSKYKVVSENVMDILRLYSEDFQPASIDEAYLDLSERCLDYREAFLVAEIIRQKIENEIGITCSVGIAPTKSLAKIASDFNKPNGITIIEPETIRTFLNDLDIRKISGIGKKSVVYFHKRGIKKIKDFYKLGSIKITEWFGKQGEWIWKVINGLDDRPVKEFHDRKSIGKERTFNKDISNREQIYDKFKELNERLHDILKSKGIYYKTIAIKIRFEDFSTFTRAKSCSNFIRDKKYAFKTIISLFDCFLNEKKKIRLIGIRFSTLKNKLESKQISIFQFLTRSTNLS